MEILEEEKTLCEGRIGREYNRTKNKKLTLRVCKEFGASQGERDNEEKNKEKRENGIDIESNC